MPGVVPCPGVITCRASSLLALGAVFGGVYWRCRRAGAQKQDTADKTAGRSAREDSAQGYQHTRSAGSGASGKGSDARTLHAAEAGMASPAPTPAPADATRGTVDGDPLRLWPWRQHGLQPVAAAVPVYAGRLVPVPE